MRNFTQKLLAFAIAGSVCSLAAGAVPNNFTAGSPAEAEKVNANFTNLDRRVTNTQTEVNTVKGKVATLETKVSALEANQGGGGGEGPVTEKTINCDDGENLLKEFLATPPARISLPLTVSVSGNCTGPIEAVRDNLHLKGPFTITGGFFPDDDPDKDKPTALGVIAGNFKLENATIASGGVGVWNGGSARFEGVNLPAPDVDEDESEGDEKYYKPNVIVARASMLRWNLPPANAAIQVRFNSTIRIDGTKKQLPVTQLELMYNSSARIRKAKPFKVAGELYLEGNSTLIAEKTPVEAREVGVDSGSSLIMEKAPLTATEDIDLHFGSSLVAPKVAAESMGCTGSSFMVGDDEFQNKNEIDHVMVFDIPELHADAGCSGQIFGLTSINDSEGFRDGAIIKLGNKDVGFVMLDSHMPTPPASPQPPQEN